MAARGDGVELHLQPDRHLMFSEEVKGGFVALLTVTNPTSVYTTFKVMTNRPQRYCVRPNQGLLPASHTVKLTVVVDSEKAAELYEQWEQEDAEARAADPAAVGAGTVMGTNGNLLRRKSGGDRFKVMALPVDEAIARRISEKQTNASEALAELWHGPAASRAWTSKLRCTFTTQLASDGLGASMIGGTLLEGADEDEIGQGAVDGVHHPREEEAQEERVGVSGGKVEEEKGLESLATVVRRDEALTQALQQNDRAKDVVVEEEEEGMDDYGSAADVNSSKPINTHLAPPPTSSESDPPTKQIPVPEPDAAFRMPSLKEDALPTTAAPTTTTPMPQSPSDLAWVTERSKDPAILRERIDYLIQYVMKQRRREEEMERRLARLATERSELERKLQQAPSSETRQRKKHDETSDADDEDDEDNDHTSPKASSSPEKQPPTSPLKTNTPTSSGFQLWQLILLATLTFLLGRLLA